MNDCALLLWDHKVSEVLLRNILKEKLCNVSLQIWNMWKLLDMYLQNVKALLYMWFFDFMYFIDYVQ